MASPNQRKRSFEDAFLNVEVQSHENTQTVEQPESVLLVSRAEQCSALSVALRAKSPALSHDGSRTRENSASMNDVATGSNASKRRKMTAAEKEAGQLQKQAKENQKAEEKTRKVEERRVKEEEREEKRKAKEAEKQAKDEEKKRINADKKAKDDEKSKKEKSQLRLNSFFSAPNLPRAGLETSPGVEIDDPVLSRRNSIVSAGGAASKVNSRASSVSPKDLKKLGYGQTFPSFFVQSHTVVAPFSRFVMDDGRVSSGLQQIERGFTTSSTVSAESLIQHGRFDIGELVHIPPHKRSRRSTNYISVKEIVARIHGTVTNPIDLTIPRPSTSTRRPVELLKNVRTKYLRFAEDVRPAYIGTYTRAPLRSSVLRLCRNPFSRTLPSINYDYDSEAEWEEPEEGEDLDSEVEEELGEDEDADDMDGFLDDDEMGDGLGIASNKRRHIMGDLEPISTGLCWERASLSEEGPGSAFRKTLPDTQFFKLELILDNHKLPINPHSATYWQPVADAKPSIESPRKASLASMDPPARIPLHTLNRTNAKNANPLLAANQPKVSTLARASANPKRIVAAEILEDFKIAIQGSDLTKAGLVEVLKKQFPKASKDAIKDTLGAVAVRVGAKEVDKVWILKN